jgi:hypothetical protein
MRFMLVFEYNDEINMIYKRKEQQDDRNGDNRSQQQTQVNNDTMTSNTTIMNINK